MDQHLEAGILTASQPLQLPGYGERRVLSPAAVKRLAAASSAPPWEVEACALEIDVVPLHYLRNLAEYSMTAQARLLRAAVALVGSHAAIERAAELLAIQGVGRIYAVAPALSAEEEPLAAHLADRLCERVRNRNASAQTFTRTVRFRGGNPAEAVADVQLAAACLPDSASEQLLQFACRMRRIPLVLAGVEESRAQATTIFPGDPGVALVYKPNHPHLSSDRTQTRPEPRTALAAGAWIAEQVVAVILDAAGILRNTLLYADLNTAEMAEYSLTGS